MNKQVFFRVDEKVFNQINDEANKHDQSVSDYVRGQILSSLNKQQTSVAGEVKYISNLLTSLVKKVSKSDPEEAERMIQDARNGE